MITIDFTKVIFWPALAFAVYLDLVPLWFLIAIAAYSFKVEGTFELQ